MQRVPAVGECAPLAYHLEEPRLDRQDVRDKQRGADGAWILELDLPGFPPMPILHRAFQAPGRGSQRFSPHEVQTHGDVVRAPIPKHRCVGTEWTDPTGAAAYGAKSSELGKQRLQRP